MKISIVEICQNHHSWYDPFVTNLCCSVHAAVQGICKRAESTSGAVGVSLAAFNMTVREFYAINREASNLEPVAGKAIKIDALHFLRTCTFRIIACLTLGLPVNTLTLQEASEVVYSINGYFKARSIDLLRF